MEESWDPAPLLPVGDVPVQFKPDRRRKRGKRIEPEQNTWGESELTDEVSPSSLSFPSSTSTVSVPSEGQRMASESKIRALTKKLRQIEQIEKRMQEGYDLDEGQLAKLSKKAGLQKEIDSLTP